MDGQDDVRLAGPGQVVTVDLTSGAGIGSWDIRPVRHALTAVMRRRPEAYHETLRAHEAERAREPRRRRPRPRRRHATARAADAPASIHDIVLIKEQGLSEPSPLRPLRTTIRPGPLPGAGDRRRHLGERPAPTSSATPSTAPSRWSGSSSIVSSPPARLHRRQPGSSEPAPVRVTKELLLGGDRRDPTLELGLTVENRSDRADRGAPRARVDAHDARWRRQPVGLVGGRRHTDRPRRPRGPPRPSRLWPRATTTLASPWRPRSRPRRRPGGRRSRRSRTPRAASSASTRDPGCC